MCALKGNPLTKEQDMQLINQTRVNNLKTGGGKPEYIPPNRMSSLLGVTCEGYTVKFSEDATTVKRNIVDEETVELPSPSASPVRMEIVKEDIRPDINVNTPQIRKGFFRTNRSDPEAQPLDVRITNVESRLPTIEEQISSLDSGFTRTVNSLSNRFTDVETELGELLEKINLFPDPRGDKTAEMNATAELHNQLIILEEELKNVVENQHILLEERENKQHSLDVITEQVEFLKAVKADREDLEDALADKADACLINRKVSYEQFDQACGDMSKGLEEALARLTQQEALWSNALEDLQRDVSSKMDRMELSPLRDFINTKLKNLQEKFKTLTALKKEQEAAGTKSRYLRNVNCISCDKDVVMRKEVDPSTYPKPTALPPTRSMGPYLAYELDQLRKQQKCLPSNKNLNMFENALLAGKAVKSPDHICNRYCGGSHTVTTPQQRVARVGHFLEQWGPEIAPVNDTHIRGTDGQMYKARDDVRLKQLASEKPPSIHPAQNPPIHISGDVTRRSKEEEEGNEESAPTSASNQK